MFLPQVEEHDSWQSYARALNQALQGMLGQDLDPAVFEFLRDLESPVQDQLDTLTTSVANKLAIAAAGRPAWKVNQASKSPAQALTAATPAEVDWTDTVLDSDSGVSLAGNSFTCPAGKSGWYLMHVILRFDVASSGDGLVIYLYHEGSPVEQALTWAPTGNDTRAQGTFLYYLDEGEKFEIYAENTASNDTLQAGEADESQWFGLLLIPDAA